MNMEPEPNRALNLIISLQEIQGTRQQVKQQCKGAIRQTQNVKDSMIGHMTHFFQKDNCDV